MYDMYSAQGGGPNVRYVYRPRGGPQCTICTVPKGGVLMYHMDSAQGGGGSQCKICISPKGRAPMYNLYSAQWGGS